MVSRAPNSMLQSGVVSVLDFIPESEHQAIRNGSSTYDATPGFVNALATGKSVYVPYGLYRVTSNALFIRAEGQKLFGDGPRQSVIRCTSATGVICTMTALDGVGGFTEAFTTMQELSGIRFEWETPYQAGSVCVLLDTCATFRIHHCEMRGAEDGLHLLGSLIGCIDENFIQRNGRFGCLMQKGAGFIPAINLISFNSNRFILNDTAAIVCEDPDTPDGLTFYDNQIESNGYGERPGSLAELYGAVHLTQLGGVGIPPSATFISNWFEGNRGGRDLLLSSPAPLGGGAVLQSNKFISSLVAYNIDATNCRLDGSGNGATLTGGDLLGNVLVSNCRGRLGVTMGLAVVGLASGSLEIVDFNGRYQQPVPIGADGELRFFRPDNVTFHRVWQDEGTTGRLRLTSGNPTAPGIVLDGGAVLPPIPATNIGQPHIFCDDADGFLKARDNADGVIRRLARLANNGGIQNAGIEVPSIGAVNAANGTAFFDSDAGNVFKVKLPDGTVRTVTVT